MVLDEWRRHDLLRHQLSEHKVRQVGVILTTAAQVQLSSHVPRTTLRSQTYYGCFYVDASKLTVTDSSFTSTTVASGHRGAAAHLESGSTGVFTDVSFTSASSNLYGGAVGLEYSTGTFTRATFTSTTANFGGGVFVKGSTASFTDTDFVSGKASYSYGGNGGCLNVQSSSVISIDGGSFTACSAGGHGGAVFIDDSTATINGTTFTSCTASDFGGGAYAEDSILTMSTFSASFSSASGGAGVYITGSTVVLDSGTFTSGVATYNGGGVYATGSTLTATDLTFTSNSATYGMGAFYFYSTSGTNKLGNVRFAANSGYTTGYHSIFASDVETYGSGVTVSCTTGCDEKGMYQSACTPVTAASYSGLTCASRLEGAGSGMLRETRALRVPCRSRLLTAHRPPPPPQLRGNRRNLFRLPGRHLLRLDVGGKRRVHQLSGWKVPGRQRRQPIQTRQRG